MQDVLYLCSVLKMRQILSLIAVILSTAVGVHAAGQQEPDSTATQELDDVTITARRSGQLRLAGAVNGTVITRDELFRAACCNLGESFTTNASVDVNYSDAATGAKQIRLLGLSGTYVQMLTENLPNFRGAASAFALDYVPGPWMNSIQVSKGAASVRNGYESITGQIDIEYLKPDNDEGLTLNLYGNTLSRMEANADANIHLANDLSTELLLHYQDDYGHHDQNNDGFLDQPRVQQWNMQNRWKWRAERYLMHAGLAMIREQRDWGQTTHSSALAHHTGPLYKIGIHTDRYEGYMKHAFILDPQHGTNIALMGNVSLHQTDADYGRKHYDAHDKTALAQLMFETSFTQQHNLSAGLSLNHDYIQRQQETTPGIYAQYTYTPSSRLTLMGGLRADHSSLYGTFVTPRFHLKLTPADVLSLNLSAGKGYRTPHALAENHNLLASGRKLVIDKLQQESAWNYGLSTSLYIPLLRKTLKLNAEYYHTRFSQQAIIDYDTDPTHIHITNLHGRSYSNTFQIDASYPVLSQLHLTAAWRWNDVKTTYGGKLMRKPLTSRYKGLLTASYKTPLELWQFDVTLQLNGGGRIPPSSSSPNFSSEPPPSSHFHAYEQLSAQLTRWFRHFSLYIGCENITGFRQRHTIIDPGNPWSTTFDPTIVWGPVHSQVAYAGIRVNIGRL